MRGPRPLPEPWNRCSITAMGSCAATAIPQAAAYVYRMRRCRTARRKSPEVRRDPPLETKGLLSTSTRRLNDHLRKLAIGG
jgi:hypothetical protein